MVDTFTNISVLDTFPLLFIFFTPKCMSNANKNKYIKVKIPTRWNSLFLQPSLKETNAML